MRYDNMFIRLCNKDDLGAVLALQDLIIDGLSNKSFLRRNSPELFELALTPPNMTAGVFVGEELIAVGMLVDPKPPETDLRKNLQKYNVDKALDMKLIMVRSDYRGRLLQRALMWILEKQAYYMGYTHLCTSISPDNVYSLHNALELDYKLDHRETLYGGLLRNVYVKEIAVASYVFKTVLATSQYMGKPCFSPEIDLSGFIPGEIGLASSGDVAEYVDNNSGEKVYGSLVKETRPFVLLPNDNNKWEFFEFSPEFADKYTLKTLWINTEITIPFSKSECLKDRD